MPNVYDPDNTGDPAVLLANQDAKHAEAMAKYQEEYDAWLDNAKKKASVVKYRHLYQDLDKPIKPRHPDPSKR